MPDFFYHSAEIRWFLRDLDQRDQILRWFRLQDQLTLNGQGQYNPKTATGPSVKLEQERTDEYLLLPDCDTVSVKQRQGRLEVKALVAGPRPFSLNAVTGRVDQWVKWSFVPSEKTLSDGTVLGEQLDRELGRSGRWCKVAKNRYLQKYSFDSGSLAAVSPNLRPDTGCNIEFTVIGVESNVGPWLTFGFEAFGPSGQVMALLDEAVMHFFAVHGPAPVPLDGRDSLNYPAWLAMLR